MRTAAALAVLLALPAACAGAEDRLVDPTADGVIEVPSEVGTIQEAVDAAGPGDLVLVAPGTYTETVIVETADVVVRGLERDAVVIDGELTRENGIMVFSDGVAIENLTVRNHTENGVYFAGDYDREVVLTGYRASYVTAYNNGRYGIYAFNARRGLIEHSYGGGHPESGFYIGQCDPCDALIVDSVAENNTFGYTGTNASGGLYLAANLFTGNRVGVEPHSGSFEELPPQHDAVIVGNEIIANNLTADLLYQRLADIDDRYPAGVGVWIRGGNDNLITRNRIVDNTNAGVLVALNVDDEQWAPSGNRTTDNAISGSRFDLALVVPDPATGPAGNCFAGNDATSTLPADLEARAPCDGPGRPLGEPASTDAFLDMDEVATDYADMAAPGPQPSMPDPTGAPAVPASVLERLDRFDPGTVALPSG